jgi:putative ABC transport system permease protein
MYAMLAVAAPIITSNYGINIALSGISSHEWMLLGFVQLAGIIIGFFPALRAYRQSLSDGMTIRI